MKIELPKNWHLIKKFFHKSFFSNLHFSIATTYQNEPHVVPIGSILLSKEGQGIFFEIFTRSMGESGEKIEILAVNSSKWFWIQSLIRGGFSSPPAIRLRCVLGERRTPRDDEIRKWQKRVAVFKYTPGYRKLWGSLTVCREFMVVSAESVELGEMTSRSQL